MLNEQKELIKEGWQCSSVVECLPSMLRALNSILSIEKNQKAKIGLYSNEIFKESLLCAWPPKFINGLKLLNLK
jgi:hypothetical protein